MKNAISHTIKLLFPISILITLLASSGCNKKEKVPLCDQHKEYFEGKTTILTSKDSVDVEKYNDRLIDLYSGLKEIYYKGTYPYILAYNMKYYDTSLLFNTVRLYKKSIDQYNSKVGIPITLVTNIINNDAVIIGEVIDKINHYKKCRYFTTTYFIKVTSVIHSYFPLSINDTILIQSYSFGVTGYCESNKPTSRIELYGMHDYEIGEKNLLFLLNRRNYIRAFETIISKKEQNYKDPYCYNSFSRQARNEIIQNKINNTNIKNLKSFVKQINSN